MIDFPFQSSKVVLREIEWRSWVEHCLMTWSQYILSFLPWMNVNTAHKLDFQSNHELLCSDKLNWEAGADILSGCIFALLPLPPILLLVCSHFSDWYLCLCLCLYLYLYFCICSFWCIFHTHSHPFPQSFFLYHTFPTATSIYCPENSIPLNLSFYFELFFDKAP